MNRGLKNTVFVCGVILTLAAAFYSLYRLAMVDNMDFTAFWTGGKALDLGLDPYSMSTVHRFTPVHHSYIAPFWSPIYLAELMQPFALFPLHAMRMLFLLINVGLAFALLVLILKLSNIKVSPVSLTVGGISLLAFEPLFYTLRMGQTDIIVALFCALSLYLYKLKRYFLAGFVFCFAAMNPHLLLGFSALYIYLMIRRRNLKLFLGASAGTLTLVLASIPYAPYVREWFQRVLPQAQHAVEFGNNQITVTHWLLALHNQQLSGALLLVLDIIFVIVGVVAWSLKSDFEDHLAVAAVLSILLTPFAFIQDYLMLVFTVPYFVAGWRRGVSERRLGFHFFCVFTLLFSSLSRLIPLSAFMVLAPYGVSLLIFIWLDVRARSVTRLRMLVVFLLISFLGSFGVLLTTFNFESLGILTGLVVFLTAMFGEAVHDRIGAKHLDQPGVGADLDFLQLD